MIKPSTLWALMKSCDDSEWLGTVCRALGGQDVRLDFGQRQMVESIKQDSGWMDERIEAQRERWRRQKRDQRGSFSSEHADIADIADLSTVRADAADTQMSAGQSDVRRHPSVHPSLHPSKNINRSVTVTVPAQETERNENGTDFTSMVRGFQREAANDEGAFFDPTHDPVIIAASITGDGHSGRAFRKELNRVGEDVFRTECHSFYRECMAGEVPQNRGAALYSRLHALPTHQP